MLLLSFVHFAYLVRAAWQQANWAPRGLGQGPRQAGVAKHEALSRKKKYMIVALSGTILKQKPGSSKNNQRQKPLARTAVEQAGLDRFFRHIGHFHFSFGTPMPPASRAAACKRVKIEQGQEHSESKQAT